MSYWQISTFIWEILASTNPWDEFEYAVDLDVAGKYWMFWTLDDETQTITFEVNFTELTDIPCDMLF